MLHNKLVNIIVAIGENNVIGKNNALPWPRIRSDMKRFQDLTISHSVVMGRKTWDSLPEKLRPLRDRQNIVVSRNPMYQPPAPKVIVAVSVTEAILRSPTDVVFIIGGAEIYKEALFYPFVDSMYITHVRGKYDGDVFFPEYSRDEWELRRSQKEIADTVIQTSIEIDFTRYDKISSAAP